MPVLVVADVGRINFHLSVPEETDGSYIGLVVLSFGLYIHVEIGQVSEDCFKHGEDLMCVEE